MGYSDRIALESLVGEVLTHVDIFSDEILLTTESGRKIQIHHDQDCCESVGIVDTEGNWQDLVGKPLLEASTEIDPDNDPVFIETDKNYHDSWTNTKLTFRVDGATVINRWIGDSNGYYSENVDFEDITKG